MRELTISISVLTDYDEQDLADALLDGTLDRMGQLSSITVSDKNHKTHIKLVAENLPQ